MPREGSVLAVHSRAEASSPQRALSPHLGASGVRLRPANCAWCGPPHREGGLARGGLHSGCVPQPRLHNPQPHVHELPPANPELFSGTFRPVGGSLRGRSCSGCRDVQFLSRSFSVRSISRDLLVEMGPSLALSCFSLGGGRGQSARLPNPSPNLPLPLEAPWRPAWSQRPPDVGLLG